MAHTAEERNAYSILVGRPERQKQLGRLWHRQEANTKVDIIRNRMGGHGLD
jgi:hypothetical protein